MDWDRLRQAAVARVVDVPAKDLPGPGLTWFSSQDKGICVDRYSSDDKTRILPRD